MYKICFLFLLLITFAVGNNQYNYLFIKYGTIYNIPPELLWGIAKHESDFNPNVINKNENGTQDTGLMQINSIHTETIKKLNFAMNDLYKPEVSIYLASKILSKCFKKHGFNWKGLNCYNGRIENNNYSNLVIENVIKNRKNIGANIIIK